MDRDDGHLGLTIPMISILKKTRKNSYIKENRRKKKEKKIQEDQYWKELGVVIAFIYFLRLFFIEKYSKIFEAT